jgi:hypothetical protein
VLAGLAVVAVVLPALLGGPAAFVILVFAFPMTPFLVLWALLWFLAGLSAYKRFPQVPQGVITAAGLVAAFASGVLLLLLVFPHHLQKMFKL